ncbi:myelin basic protein isoform X3 [Tamandua tetradactyla]|uniref:myelin basic protein isoform X3 n=1 Tax=Tamandua tetradactyla TaxID=48850 RepID=UPI0040543134
MGNHAGKRQLVAERANKDSETNRGESEKKRSRGEFSQETLEDSEVFGEADVSGNNGASSKLAAVTDARLTADPKNAWQGASPADRGSRPHLVRLFSRDAPGREDNTFKDRPSESDELQTIPEDSAATSEPADAMASQKRPSQRHGSKYLATASTVDHARHGFLPRHRDTGILDSLGRFFGSDRGVPKRGSGKVPWLKPSRSPLPSAPGRAGLCGMYQDHAARAAHYGSLPQKAQHGRPQDENPVVHFFKNIVTPRTPPPSQGKGRGLALGRFSWGAEGQKPGFGYGRGSDFKSAHKGLKGAHDAQGALSRIFKLGGRDSRSGSPMARR